MSSIYKKGRDGYYYYQAYVQNPVTGKKDKRIFHSLSTKDKIVAEKKQQELDLKYEKKNYVDSNSSRLSNDFIPKPTKTIIVVITALIIILFGFINSILINQNTGNSSFSDKAELIEKKIEIVPKIIEPVNNLVTDRIEPDIKHKRDVMRPTPEQEQETPEIIIPKYTVERVDRLSKAFEQGKLYVTLDKNSSNEIQRLICEDLAKRYSEFSNIVICLYSNNRVGIDIARGNNETVSIEEKKRCWLAMYTYNSVEGEYFDDNPSGYLGIH